MSNETTSGRELLEDVLQAYALAEPGPGYDALSEWVRRYPQFERELTEFTASWTIMQVMPASPQLEESVNEERLVLRAISILENVLHTIGTTGTAAAPFQSSMLAQPTSEHPLTGLVDEGKRLHLSLEQLAEQCDMGKALVRKLDRRLIRPTSMPVQAIERLAQALHRSASRIAEYLAGAARFAAGAQYKSERAPILAEPESFFDAVRSDLTMTDTQRAYWLSLEPSEYRER